jgi:diguanylate cyclase
MENARARTVNPADFADVPGTDGGVAMREVNLPVRDDFRAAREIARHLEARIRVLERELAEANSLVCMDPLTQVLNRRGLDEAFAVELARAQRDGSPLAIAMLDIDNFKCLNDSHGHQAGDLALKHVSDLVRDAVRPIDTVARYGGEEFIILLPATSTAGAVNMLERLQRRLSRAFFMHHNEELLITFSAGVTARRPGDSPDSAIRRVDAALFTAKAAGKNRVQVTGA